MADITLNNPGIQADIDSMVQATTTMDSAIDDFVQIVNANIDLLQGATRDAVQQQLAWLTNAAGQMNRNFGSGTQILGNMVDLINHGDLRAAGQMAG